MTDHEGTATQADADTQSQVDTSSERESQAESQAETISLDEAKKLRSEAANLRKRLKDAESKVQAAADAGKSEDEKRSAALKAAEDKATAAEARLRDLTARSAVTDAALKVHAISPKAVYALIRDDLDFDDDGEPTNIADLIAAAKKEEPSLFRASAGTNDGGAQGDTGLGNDMNAALRRAAGRGRR